MSRAKPKEPTFHRHGIIFTDVSLDAIDEVAIKVRNARARAGKDRLFASRSEIINKLIECADMEQIIEELSR